MKIEETFSKVPMYRVAVQGTSPPKGWAVKYVSGMDGKLDIKPGFWLTMFFVDVDGYLNFNFESVLVLRWDTEAQAREASDALRQSALVETSVVNIG